MLIGSVQNHWADPKLMNEKMKLDPRINAFRPDLADLSLKAFVEAQAYVEPAIHQCIRGVVPVFKEPNDKTGRVTEIRYGEFVDVFETRDDGFIWLQNRNDRYVGYIRGEGVLNVSIAAMMNRVVVPYTFVYAQPSMKSEVLDTLTLGSFVSLDGEAGDFYPLASGGFVFKKHVVPTDEAQTQDYVFTAGQLLGVPYLWGGRTPLGIDCSGLVQLALDMAGIDCPRDSDQQRELFGHPLPSHWRDIVWKRGDIVFLRDAGGSSHVGIMTSHEHIIHAIAHTMQVTVEPLRDVIDRGYEILSAGRP